MEYKKDYISTNDGEFLDMMLEIEKRAITQAQKELEEEKAKNESKNNNWRFGVVGNIVKQHLDSEGIVRFGTKAFTGGTKIYLNGKNYMQGGKNIEVIGRNRFGRTVTDFIPLEYIENIRTQRVYKPVVLEIMAYLEAVEGDYWFGRTAADRKESELFVKQMGKNN